MSMYGLGTVLLISAGTGRYGLAGTVAAVSALGNAFCAPQLGRLVDRLGQHRVLVPICVIFALSVAGLVTAVQLRFPDWTLFAFGIVGGATMPQLGPMARARWSVLLAGTSRLHTAFSIESIADELCFIVGPAAVTLLATQVHPAAGVATAAICCLGGTLWFAAQRATEPPVKRSRAPALPAPGRCRSLASRPQLLAGGAGACGAGARVPVPRLDVRVGRPVDGGLRRPVREQAAGGRDPRLLRARQRDRRPLVRVAELAGAGRKRLAVTLSLTVAGVCTFWAMPNLLVLAIVIYLCGLTIAPTLIAGYSLLESTALPGRATEAMSWLGTGISVGVALGATAAGSISTRSGRAGGTRSRPPPASPPS